MINRLKETIKHVFTTKEFLIPAIVLLIGAIAHGYNMFHFPYYENDEGTYMSQAWSLLTSGELAPYTYWYDHAPAGWMLIALWVKLTGWFFTFGVSVNSGRVLMFILHIFSSGILLYISKKLRGGYFAGVIAVLIFSLSPLAIYFQRRVLLDNIMVFWVLLSWALLLENRLKLTHIAISAILFGIAVLTKENAFFFIPAFMYLILTRAHIKHRSFALVKWLTISGFVVSIYFIYAFLKSELLPGGDHVSLFSTLSAQLSRGSSLPFWEKNSEFYISFLEWIERDRFTIMFGAVATLISLIISIKEKSLRSPLIFLISFWIFLLRGKLVINFYVVPLIPLLALNIGMLFDVLVQAISLKRMRIKNAFNVIVSLGVFVFFLSAPAAVYVADETTPQLQALEWVFDNVPKDTVIAIDDFAEVDYREEGYTKAFWFWKMWYDPEVQEQFGNEWENIKYLYVSHEMLRQIGFRVETDDVLRTAFLNSKPIVKFGPMNKGTFINFSNFETTNGDWAAVYKLKEPEEIVLGASWAYFKQNFIRSYGQVIDPQSGNTTSEGQSYGMLRAVWLNDRTTFDGVWKWTQDHMQYRSQDKLFSWLWSGGDDGSVVDSASASDADQDIALALIFAYEQWGNIRYLLAAEHILNDIWEKEVVTINGRYYLTSGSGAARVDGYLVNPSYLSPAWYRIFAQVDISHDWTKLADDSYTLLNEVGALSETHLPTNWLLLQKNGNIASASPYVGDPEVDSYGFDAFRTMWRVALDASWFNASQAHSYLKTVSPFLEAQWTNNKKITAIYSIAGDPRVEYESLSTTTGALAALSVTNKDVALNMFNEKMANAYNSEGYWGGGQNYYDQNWAWFGSALYTGSLPNLAR